MLAIARTLMGNPKLLLLDEPSEGLAPALLEALAAALTTLRDQGLTLLLAEQDLRFAARLAEKAVVMERGTLVWRGPLSALRADPEMLARYLGA